MWSPWTRWLPARCAVGALLPVLVSATGCESKVEAEVQIRGSDSEVNAVQRMAEQYMAKHPKVSVAVTGGGSGVGIASLLDGTCDIANSSRPLKPQERLLAHRKGVEPVATKFATDALTVIVNESNPVTALRVPQVGAMFSGKLSDWGEVGGQAGTNVVGYGRQSSSGTFAFFRDAVVKGAYGQQVRAMSGNGQIVEAVSRDPGGIGYVAVGYLKAGAAGIKALKISTGEGAPVSPLNKRAVLAGNYPIARPLYQFTDGTPEGAVRDFMRFELSPAGEEILEEMGFYPLIDAWKADNAHLWKETKKP